MHKSPRTPATKSSAKKPAATRPKPAAKPKSKRAAPKRESVDTMPIDTLRDRAAQALGLLGQVEAILPGLLALSATDREHSGGRWRDGEEVALSATLDAAEAAPQYFVGLADKDHGTDPERFETDALRDRIERRTILAKIAKAITPLASDLTDTVLHLGEITRGPILEAYGIAKSVAPHDKVVASKIARARTFYSRPAIKGLETRRQKAKKAAAAAAEATKSSAAK